MGQKNTYSYSLTLNPENIITNFPRFFLLGQLNFMLETMYRYTQHIFVQKFLIFFHFYMPACFEDTLLYLLSLNTVQIQSTVCVAVIRHREFASFSHCAEGCWEE
jgi:hypothetical protein